MKEKQFEIGCSVEKSCASPESKCIRNVIDIYTIYDIRIGKRYMYHIYNPQIYLHMLHLYVYVETHINWGSLYEMGSNQILAAYIYSVRGQNQMYLYCVYRLYIYNSYVKSKTKTRKTKGTKKKVFIRLFFSGWTKMMGSL